MIKASIFLIETLFSLYLIVIILRFILQWMRASFYDAPSQFILALTNPVIMPLNRLIPRWRNIELSSVVLIFVLAVLEATLINLLAIGEIKSIIGLLFQAIFSVVFLVLEFYFFSILIEAIASWLVPPGNYNPITNFLHRINDPLLNPVRKLIPTISGFDLSPLIVLLILQILIIIMGEF